MDKREINIGDKLSPDVKEKMGISDEPVETVQEEKSIPVKQQPVAKSLEEIAAESCEEIGESSVLGDLSGDDATDPRVQEYKEAIEAEKEQEQKELDKLNEEHTDIDIFNESVDEDINFNEPDQTQTTEELNLLADEDEDIMYTSYKDVQVQKHANDKLNILDKIEVDLNNIEIVEKSALKQMDDYDAIFNEQAAPIFNVVACQSGYSAGMTGLSLNDINAITNSTMDQYKYRERMLRIIYENINTMSIAKPDFNTWLKITATGDIDTLLFGIFNQTFPDENEFDITCNHCGRQTTVIVNNHTLVEAKSKKVFSKIHEVVHNAKSAADLVNKSLVHVKERVMLEDSKIIFELYNPSLHDQLRLLKSTNSKLLENYGEILALMFYIKNIYIPDLDAIAKTGQAQYYPIKDAGARLNTILKLNTRDGLQLKREVEKRIKDLLITYTIKNATCRHCENQLPSIPVDMETVLFHQIAKTQGASI